MDHIKSSGLFSANAKLMISGEYLVLHGAQALSIPLKNGQKLKITEHEGNASLVWKTYVKGKPWFEAIFSLNDFVIANTDDFPTAINLRNILLAMRSLAPQFLIGQMKYEAFSELDFEITLGLGSSSSLLVNMANWAKIDPFELLQKVSSGSGYDVATAMSQKPILYRITNTIPEVIPCNFYPVFHEHLYFAYLGRKRNSALAIQEFYERTAKDFSSYIIDLDIITKSMVAAVELREFRKLMHEHERIISAVIGTPPIGTKEFADFNGEIKSLGAWGGDFILLATEMPREYVISWLRNKDLNTWFKYEDIALMPEKPLEI